MRLLKYIKEFNISELSYPGNLGAMEMMKFFDIASSEEKKEMDSILRSNDWKKFKKLILKVVGVKLQ